MNDGDVKKQLLELTEALLQSITSGDWKSYTQICDPTISAFEPEARGHLVEGIAFHRFYFEREAALERKTAPNTTVASPHVRLLGDDAAIVSYVRLVQTLKTDGAPQTAVYDETRVFEREGASWRHVHFHRSLNANQAEHKP